MPGTLPINSLFSAEVNTGAGIPEGNLITEEVGEGGGEKKTSKSWLLLKQTISHQ